MYFTEETENAIILFNNMTSVSEKSILFQDKIYFAFDKLIENLIHTYKFNYYETTYDELKCEAVSFLHEKMAGYTKSKGKAFSYFTKVATNFLLGANMRGYKRLKFTGELSIIDATRNVVNEVYNADRQENLDNFIDIWIEWNSKNLNHIYKSKKERKIADAVIELFNTRKSLESFSKKYLYILVREQTDFTTNSITPVVNKMKQQFYTMYYEYCDGNLVFPDYSTKTKN